MTYVPLSNMGTRLVTAMAPWINDELAWVMDAIGTMADPVYNLVYDQGTDGQQGYVPGYGSLLNPQLCDPASLPYLGQFVGVQVPPGTDPVTALSLVTTEAGLNRGTVHAIQSAIVRNISTAWQPNYTYSAGLLVSYGNPPTYYLTTSYTSGATFQQSNLVDNPSFEYDTTNTQPAWWLPAVVGHSVTPGTGVITPSSGTLTTFGVQTGWAASGSKSVRMTATNVPQGDFMVLRSPLIAVTPNEPISFSIVANSLNAATSTSLAIAYFDSSLNFLGASSRTGAPGAITTLSFSTDVIPNCVYVSVWPLLINTSGVTSTLDGYYDAVLVSPVPTVPAYFDGDSANSSWSGTPGDSASVGTALSSVDPGTQYAVIERSNPLGAADAYWITILVRPEQLTPASNGTALLAAVNAVKPGGVLINLVQSDSPLISQGGRNINAVAGGVLFANAKLTDIN